MAMQIRSLAACARYTACFRAYPAAVGGSYARVVPRTERWRPSIGMFAGQSRWQSKQANLVVLPGYKVSVDFKVTHQDNGTVIDSSEGKGPLVFVCGHGRVMGAVDSGVIGMEVGETKTISGDLGYGTRDPTKKIEFPLERLPKDVKVGTQLQMQKPDGKLQTVTVAVLRKTSALIDFNHPLAGESLSCTITVLGCEENVRLKKLVVETLSPGDGKTYPKQGDTVTLHYTGSLLADGMKFDCSRDRGQPFTVKIGVGQVIQGWDDGIVQMSLGERAKLHIPAYLGYGNQGAGGVIPPDEDLAFDVELIKIS